jgi:hypothetical protein
MHDHRHDHDHDHGAGEGHGHSHESGGENYSSRRHPEQVVLDIGGNVGALIVHTDPAMHGVEVEISATGQDDRREHKDVLEREINGRPAFTAVFDRLREGSYTLWVDDVARARGVVVTGAEVAQLDWSGELAPPIADPPRSATADVLRPIVA